MSKHRTKYTEEQRVARDATDTAIRDNATELLTDPDAVAAMISHLMTTNSPKLLRYSMRNIARSVTVSIPTRRAAAREPESSVTESDAAPSKSRFHSACPGWLSSAG